MLAFMNLFKFLNLVSCFLTYNDFSVQMVSCFLTYNDFSVHMTVLYEIHQGYKLKLELRNNAKNELRKISIKNKERATALVK